MSIKSLIVDVELWIILLVSLAAGFALLGTNSLCVVPIGVLISLGTITIVVLPVGAFTFGAGAVLMTLPALMKVNGVKWWLFSPERLDFCPTLSFPSALSIGLLVVSGSLALGYLQALRRELRALDRARADSKESRACAVGQLGTVLSATRVSTLVSAIVVIVVAALQGILTPSLEGLSSLVLAAGVISLAMLASGVFWIVASRRDRASVQAADKHH